jgi:hypothetical protein
MGDRVVLARSLPAALLSLCKPNILVPEACLRPTHLRRVLRNGICTHLDKTVSLRYNCVTVTASAVHVQIFNNWRLQL